ncbi:hypothetical protein C8R42DRAFT_653828 [Lentinula raphanica]|nr:hypothetical protein C8R42DRAFT_653828 [Lentinula raphanica]
MMIKWSKHGTWSLITQIKLSENFKVLYGQASNENSSGDTKHTVHQRIAAALQVWNGTGEGGNMGKLASRVKNRISWYVKLLKKTGEDFLPSGPDHDTEPRTISIWDQFVLNFKFFWIYIMPGNVLKEPVSPKAATPPLPPLGLFHSNCFTSLISSTPPLTPSQDTKENLQPLPSFQCTPHSSAFFDKKPVPASLKVGFEDKMIGFQWSVVLFNIKALSDQCAGDHCKLLHDAQTQLLNEYKSDIWTVEQYCVEQKKLNELYGSPKKTNHHAPSPDWDEDHLNADVTGNVL